VVGVRADAPWKNFKEFVDYAKKNPGKIRITSIGVGSSTHFAIAMLESITGIQLTHVPFEGGDQSSQRFWRPRRGQPWMATEN